MSLARGLIHPRLMAHIEKTVCPSRITIQENTPGVPTATGARVSQWTDVEDHVDLPCMLAAVTGTGASTGASSGEVREDTGLYGVDARTVAIPRYLPSITDAHRAVIDGAVWNIVDVAHDSQSIKTRLRVRAVSGVDDGDGGS